MKLFTLSLMTCAFLLGAVHTASAEPSRAPTEFHALNGITVSTMSDEELAKIEGQGDTEICCIGGVPIGIFGIPPNPVFPTDPVKTLLFNYFTQGIPPNPIIPPNPVYPPQPILPF